MTSIRPESAYWVSFGKDLIVNPETKKERWRDGTPERVIKSWLSWLKINHMKHCADPIYNEYFKQINSDN